MKFEINTHEINELQFNSIMELLPLLQQAHYTNIRVGINGEWQEFEGDWLKSMKLTGRNQTEND